MRLKRYLSALLPLLFGAAIIAPAGAASEPGLAGVKIDYRPPQVFVRITQTTDLRTVLEEFCRQTQTNCELAPEAAQEMVPPLALQGTWSEVVSKLLEGSKLNYVSLAPSAGQAGRVLVGVRSPAASTPQELAGRQERSPALEGRGAGARPELSTTPSPSSEMPSPVPSRGGQLREGVSPVGNQSSPLATAPAGVSPVPATRGRSRLENPGATEPAASVGMLPFFMGGPRSSEPPSNPPVLPFPDANGNPIPLSNQPITVSPFPDQWGQPVPLHPFPPGTIVGSPFPPEISRSHR